MGEYKSVMDPNDMDEVFIYEVKFKDLEDDLAKDVRIKFPEGYEKRNISFMDAGIWNAVPGSLRISTQSTPDSPKVSIDFYGIPKIIKE